MNITFENLGTVNKNVVGLESGYEKLYLYFSYKTIVGFEYQMETFCIQNYWSNTTGKLLNTIESDKSKRLTKEDFQAKLDIVMKKFARHIV